MAPTRETPQPDEVRLTVPARPEFSAVASDAGSALARRAGLSNVHIDQLQTALGHAVGLFTSRTEQICISFRVDGAMLAVEASTPDGLALDGLEGGESWLRLHSYLPQATLHAARGLVRFRLGARRGTHRPE